MFLLGAIQRRHKRLGWRFRFGLGLIWATLDALSFCFPACFLVFFFSSTYGAHLRQVLKVSVP